MGYQQNEKNGRRNVNGKGEKVKISLFIFPLPIYHHWQYRYKHESRTHQNLYKKKKRTRRVFSENVLTEKQVMTEETASSIRLLCIRSVFIKSSWKKDPMDKNLTHTR